MQKICRSTCFFLFVAMVFSLFGALAFPASAAVTATVPQVESYAVSKLGGTGTDVTGQDISYSEYSVNWYQLVLTVIEPSIPYADGQQLVSPVMTPLSANSWTMASSAVFGAPENDGNGNLKYTVTLTDVRPKSPSSPLSVRFNFTYNGQEYQSALTKLIYEFKPKTLQEENQDNITPDPVPETILTPHILIENYKYYQSITPGQDLRLDITLRNTSTSKALRNILCTFTADNGLLPKSSTNTIYIDTLTADSTKEIGMRFLTPDEIESKSVAVSLTFTFEYYINDGWQSGTSSEIANIPVRQSGSAQAADRFEIFTAVGPEYLYVGEEQYATITVINKGIEPVYNVSATITGDGLSNSGYSEYFGQVNANTKAEIELPVNALAAGDTLCNIIIGYEDKDGNVKELTKELLINAMEMEMPDYPVGPVDPVDPMEPAETEGSFPLWAWIAIGAVVVIVAIVVVVKVRKKRLAEVDDEDL